MMFRKAILAFFNEVGQPTPAQAQKALQKLSRKEHLSLHDSWDALKLAGRIEKLDDEVYGREETLTPLGWAAKNNHRDIAKALIERGAPVNLNDCAAHSPLMGAINGGHVAMAKLLLDNGARLDRDNLWEKTPLLETFRVAEFASDYPLVEMVQLLTRTGVGLDAMDRSQGTPLITAVRFGWRLAAFVLIEKGAPVNHQGYYGDTALMMAVGRGHKDIVQLLLDKGADVNLQNEKGDTALSAAAQNGHNDVVKILLEKGANLDAALEGAKKRGWANSAVEKLEAFKKQLADTAAAAPDTPAAPVAQAKPPVPK